MGKWARLHAQEPNVVTIIASLIGVAVEHEVTYLYRLDTTAHHHRLREHPAPARMPD
jgi:hypothetical protein